MFLFFLCPNDFQADAPVEDGNETTSTVASTITESIKDVTELPTIVTLEEKMKNKQVTTLKDPMCLFLQELEEEAKMGKNDDEGKKPAASTNSNKDFPSIDVALAAASAVRDMETDKLEVEGADSIMPVTSNPRSTSVSMSDSANGTSNMSLASTSTAQNSFASPSRNGGKHSIKKFGMSNLDSTGYKVKTPTRRTPTLEITFFQIGITVACICTLLNERGKESYAWKPFIVDRVIKGASDGDNEDWQGFNFTPTLIGGSLVEKRREAHGPDEALLGYNDYPERFLLFNLMSNPTFEKTTEKVTEFGKKMLEFLQFESFASYYIGEIDDTFASKKLRDSLLSMDHELWKMIKRAKLRIVEEYTLDSFFLDQKIKELVPEELWSVPADKWPATVLMKLYRSGKLPDGFADA